MLQSELKVHNLKNDPSDLPSERHDEVMVCIETIKDGYSYVKGSYNHELKKWNTSKEPIAWVSLDWEVHTCPDTICEYCEKECIYK